MTNKQDKPMTKNKNMKKEIENYKPPMHLTKCEKFNVISVDDAGREYTGFCPRCLMTEVEASEKDCEYPNWAKEALAQARQDERKKVLAEVKKLPTGPFDSTPYLKELITEITMNKTKKETLEDFNQFMLKEDISDEFDIRFRNHESCNHDDCICKKHKPIKQFIIETITQIIKKERKRVLKEIDKLWITDPQVRAWNNALAKLKSKFNDQ